MMRLPLLIAAVFTLAAGPALAQQQRIDPKDLKAPPKLPEMAAPSNIAGMIAQVDQENILVLDLSSGGRVKIVMRPDVAPKHVERIRTLARQGFYDGTVVHRVIDGFMAAALNTINARWKPAKAVAGVQAIEAIRIFVEIDRWPVRRR